MENLIQITLMIARKKMKSFGFDDEQVKQLLASGERDLKTEFARLASLLEGPSTPEELNKSLHALKGLLLNMGNEKLAERLIELKEFDDFEGKKKQLRALIFGT